MSSRILFILTSANKNLLGGQTGWFLPEAAHPFYILSPHFEIDFAAPGGPNPEVDKSSVEMHTDEESVKFLKDTVVQSKLANAKYLSQVNSKDYVAIFYVGGHGPVIDLPDNSDSIKLATEVYQQGKIVAAVCHGVAALVNVKDAQGKSIFEGKEVTSFSNAEEETVHLVEAIPFLIETEIVKLGGKYVKNAEIFKPYVVKSGNLITGQNPASGKPIGEEILKALEGTVAA